MDEEVFNRINNYYNKLVATYGYDPKSCDYGQVGSQQTKFKVLASCTNYSNKSILDIGCGFADYYDYLLKDYTNIMYHGVDLSTSMIKSAKKLHPNLQLEVRNVFENPPTRKYDIVTANGIFYLLGAEAWPLMQKFLEQMYTMCNEVVAFNTLSDWTSDKEEGEFYASPLKVLSYCRSLSPWVTIRHDYHSRDFSVFIYKNRNA